MNIDEIFGSICFIEAHLKEPVTVLDAAQSAGYSIFHFSRLFNAVTGHSPYDYIIRRRLSEAAKDIGGSAGRLTDIAFEYQFNSLETFSRAFKKMFGVSPNKLKNTEDLRQLVLKSPITYDYLTHISSNSYLKPSIVKCDGFKLVGTAVSEPYRWRILQDEFLLQELLAEMLPENECSTNLEIFSVNFYPMNRKGEDFAQLLCLKVPSFENIPEACVGKYVPEGTYIEFLHSGNMKDLEHTYKYIFETWVPLSEYTSGAPYSIERFTREEANCSDNTVVNILIPVKNIKMSE